KADRVRRTNERSTSNPATRTWQEIKPGKSTSAPNVTTPTPIAPIQTCSCINATQSLELISSDSAFSGQALVDWLTCG
uniref:Uncharacterized protein n=1 Tax=Ciona savignyi TaxID=51511 RepID=H2Z5J8_CIOSA